MNATFTDRSGSTRSVEIVEGEKLGGYGSIAPCYDDLRGPLVKLWADGHLGSRNCAITSGYSPLVQKTKRDRVYQGHGVGARVRTKPAAEAPAPKVYVPAGAAAQAAELIAALAPVAQ